MDVIMDVIESNYNHARMRAMRTLYARAADAICARHEIRPPGGATLGGLREMRRPTARRTRRQACASAARLACARPWRNASLEVLASWQEEPCGSALF